MDETGFPFSYRLMPRVCRVSAPRERGDSLCLHAGCAHMRTLILFVSDVSITGPMDVFDNTGSIKRQGQLPRACAGLTLRNKLLREKLNRRYAQEPKF